MDEGPEGQAQSLGPGVAEAGEGFLGRVAELEMEPRIVSFRQLGVCLAERVGELLGDPFALAGGPLCPGWDPTSSPGSRAPLLLRPVGAEDGGQDVFMFSCRTRVEPVAAGSRSPCVSFGEGGGSAPGKQLVPQHRHAGLKPLKG